jgi:predicted Zn-dependent protease
MAPADGKALMVFTLVQANSLEEAAANTLKQLELKAQESKSTTINGMPALVTLSKQEVQDQSTGQTQINLVTSSFISYNNIIYVFHGVTTEADFNNYSSTFNSTSANFSKLTDPAKINIKAKKLLVRKVPRTGTLSDAFRTLGVKQDQMDEMALLNNLELTSQVTAGKSIKIIGQ